MQFFSERNFLFWNLTMCVYFILLLNWTCFCILLHFTPIFVLKIKLQKKNIYSLQLILTLHSLNHENSNRLEKWSYSMGVCLIYMPLMRRSLWKKFSVTVQFCYICIWAYNMELFRWFWYKTSARNRFNFFNSGKICFHNKFATQFNSRKSVLSTNTNHVQ